MWDTMKNKFLMRFIFQRFNFKSNQGFKLLTDEQREQFYLTDRDFHIRQLFNTIAKGEFPSWTLYIQTMREDQLSSFGDKKTGLLIIDTSIFH